MIKKNKNHKEENRQVVIAFNAIIAKYGDWIVQNPNAKALDAAVRSYFHKGLGDIVRFLDDQDFAMLGVTGSKVPYCQVSAFTKTRDDDPHFKMICVRRGSANPSTLVHELLHYFTHPNFSQFIGSAKILEAVTERFTRKVIMERGDDKKLNLAMRTNRYDALYGLIKEIRPMVKDVHKEGEEQDQKPTDYMKRAYFAGEPAAITFVKSNFEMLDFKASEDILAEQQGKK